MCFQDVVFLTWKRELVKSSFEGHGFEGLLLYRGSECSDNVII